jgi:hypothetical protein
MIIITVNEEYIKVTKMRHWKFSAELKLSTALFWDATLRNGQSDPDVSEATRCLHLPVSTSPDPLTPARY